MRQSLGIRAVPLMLALGLAASVFARALPAAAVSNQAIRSKKAQVTAAQTKLSDLSDDFEMKVEEYNSISDALDQTTLKLDQTQQVLKETEARLSASQDVLAMRADTMYRGGGLDVVQVFVGATSFEDFVSRVDLLSLISSSDAELVASVRADRQRVREVQSSLENRRREQIALRSQADAKRAEVEDAVARQKAYVDTLNSQVKNLIKDEEARQQRLAAERARLAKANARQGNWSSARARSSGPLGPSHPEAAAIALKYLGCPYVWGGTSPSGFDCSGFCQYVYRQIGINLPRTSRSQYRVGSFIPENRRDLLAPGDLVFFGYNGNPNQVHHVGMYVGNGNFIHAPGAGDHVKVSSLTERVRTRGDFVGGVRP